MCDDVMAKPCAHCPFRTDVTPFLDPRRAEQIAYSAQNPYSTFPCHKTLDYEGSADDGDLQDRDGEGRETAATKGCAGFHALQISEGALEWPKDWEHPRNVYDSACDMVWAYENEARKNRGAA